MTIRIECVPQFDVLPHEKEQLADVLAEAECEFEDNTMLSSVQKFMRRLGSAVQPRHGDTEIRRLRYVVAQVKPKDLPEFIEWLRGD